MMKKVIGFMVGVMLPLLSMAHGYWLEIEGSRKVGEVVKVKLFFGEIDENHVRHKEADTAQFLLVASGPGEMDINPLSFTKKDNYWEATFTPKAKGKYTFFALNSTSAVVDRSATGGKNLRPWEYLYAGYEVEGTQMVQQKTSWPTIRVENKGTKAVIYATNANKPVPMGTKIRVFKPDNQDLFLTTDNKGVAEFITAQEGLYIIRYDYVNPTPGNYLGVKYVEERHLCNYSYYRKK